jgi:hypothetical protein
VSVGVELVVAAALAAAAPAEAPTSAATAERTESVEAEPVEAEPVEAEPVEAEPVEADENSDPPEPMQDESVPDDEPPARASDDELLTVAAGANRERPPFYTEADEAKLRARFELDVESPEDVQPAKWRCLIADPTCGINFEVNATSAYAHRLRQGGVRDVSSHSWHSARVQYDFWLNLPVLVETIGENRFSRLTMGPKGGVVFSDSGDLWGNLGFATRYWLGRGRWAPTIEFTSALTFKLGGRSTRTMYDASGQLIEPKFRMTRGPAGFSADIGFGFGGFGAIVLGGQYDSPFAREDVPEIFRTPAAGMFFVGFRGNILWGGPAGAAVLTHLLAQRHAGPGI